VKFLAAAAVLFTLLLAPGPALAQDRGDGSPESVNAPLSPISVLPLQWTDPGAAAAAAGAGLVEELTRAISGPLEWAWAYLFLVPDAIDPDRADQVDAALARIAPAGIGDPIFSGRGTALAVRQAWERSRELALSSRLPFLGLVLGAFAVWALAMLFLGRPVDMAAAAGRLGIALIGSLASYQFVDAMLLVNDLLVMLFSRIGSPETLLGTPQQLFAAWQWGADADSLSDLGGALLQGVWFGLFRAFLQLLLLIGMAGIAIRLLVRLVWIWALTVVAPLAFAIAVLPPAARLPELWLARLLRTVFEKSALVLGLSVSFSVIALQPPGLLTVLLAIVALFVAQALPGFLLDAVAGAGSQGGRAILGQLAGPAAGWQNARRLWRRARPGPAIASRAGP
jgi:hypothetical protein